MSPVLGRGGVTHNMLDDIHNHWRRAEAVRIKCLGIPTLDMDNVCFHLEVSLSACSPLLLGFVIVDDTLFLLCRINQVVRLSTVTLTFYFYIGVDTMILKIDL